MKTVGGASFPAEGWPAGVEGAGKGQQLERAACSGRIVGRGRLWPWRSEWWCGYALGERSDWAACETEADRSGATTLASGAGSGSRWRPFAPTGVGCTRPHNRTLHCRVAKKSANRAKISSFGLDCRYDIGFFSFLFFSFFIPFFFLFCIFLPFFYRTHTLLCERGLVRVVTDQ